MKNAKNLVPLLVVGIVLLIIIPLPPFWLDLLFIVNITVSLVILLTTMYIRETLQFSIFPSVLLITTLFRLCLNISSTRLILTKGGEAGAVIKTFGEFVVGGDVVVGFIIFIIIVLVQFIVITKGSERVAEVAARFTLDAMPGKQMAIDADLSSGLIDEQTARIRRSKIQREADFFGAMDGASKFVKGDAIISIIVTFINLIGGTIIGLLVNKGNFGDVLSTYAIATVGDGLVSQLPSLIISTATGIIVTRSASENNLAEDLSKQFLSQPKVLISAGAVIAALCLIPGFPPVQILTVSALLIFLGFRIQKSGKVPLTLEEEAAQAKATSNEPEDNSEVTFYRNIDNVYGLLQVEPIEMEFGYSLIPLVDEGGGGTFIDRVVMFRKQFAMDMGMVIPSVRLRDNGMINPNQYTIKLKGEEVTRGEVLVDHYLALDAGNTTATISGIDTIEPAFGIPAKWISENRKDEAELAGYTIIDPISVIVTHMTEVIRTHAHELLTRQDVTALLENLKKTNKLLVEDTIPALLPIGDFQKILANLVREGIPIRDLETVIETVADYAPMLKDTDMLTEYARQALKRTITRKFSDGGGIKVLTLDANIENMIMGAVKKSDHGSYLALEPDAVQSVVSALVEQVQAIKNIVQNPIVLTSPVVRMYFQKISDQFCPGTYVLSFNEIDTNVQIQSLGNIEI
ncbi:MAG: flagellar biosynthesis protein FlhA [Oscillospiraceae bacterium]